MKYILSVLLFFAACADKDGTSLTDITSPAMESEPTTDEFVTLINNHRIDIGLDTLNFAAKLNSIAQSHSNNMAKGSVIFGHTGFSSRCAEARSAMGGGNLCAENVAMGQKNAEAAYSAWMNSSGHKANIEQLRMTHSGFGYAKSSSGTLYWTEIFLEAN